jgi:hypothetical protein
MSASAMAFGGLAVATFARLRAHARIGWLALAGLGLLVGFASRGALLGVAVPCFGVGAAWAIAGLAPRTGADRAGGIVGGFALALGAVAAAVGLWALEAGGGGVSRLAGIELRAPAHDVPWDRALAQIGHALLPWSAFLPFALGRLLVAPVRARRADGDRESRFRVALVAGAAAALAAHTVLAGYGELVPYTAPALLAAACGVALRDFERGARPSVAVGIGTVLLAAVLAHDLDALPEKALAPFGAAAGLAHAPSHGGVTWLVAIGITALAALLAFAEGDAGRPPFDRARFVALARDLRDATDAFVVRAYGAIVLSAAGLAAAVAIGVHGHAPWAMGIAKPVRILALQAWWALAVAPLVAAFGPPLVLDAVAWCARRAARLGFHRAALVAVGGGVGGALLCATYYPALAEQESPRSLFARYEHVRAPGEPLGLLQIGDRAAAYYVGGEATPLRDVATASTWLEGASGCPGRRYVVASASELAALNEAHRKTAHANLPILESTDRAFLAASVRCPGDVSVSPLDAVVLEAPPRPRRLLDVSLDDKVTVLGYDVVDGRGTPVDAISAGRHYRVRTYYKVTGALSSEYTVFVHVDGAGRRHNADHPVAGGHYPTTRWQAGDIVVDDYELTLEPNFTPGAYHLFFGLYASTGGGARLKVVHGPSDGQDRIDGGVLRVE